MDDRIETRSTWDNGLTYGGSLDSYAFIDLTPSIGREFPDARLVELISSENADAILRDLAITCIYLEGNGNLTFESITSLCRFLQGTT